MSARITLWGTFAWLGGRDRRLLSQGLVVLVALVVVPLPLAVVRLALAVGLLDGLDERKDYTLGYVCVARRL
jgi:hypothetical protein